MKRLTTSAIFGLAVLVLASCNQGKPQPAKKGGADANNKQVENPPPKKDEPIVKKPIRTFEGDWWTFEEKWKLVTETRVKVQFDPKKRVQFQYVVWEDGKRNPSPLYDPGFRPGDEAAFALQEADDRDKVVRKITMKIAVGIYPYVGVEFPHHTTSGFIAPFSEIMLKDGKSQNIWVFGVGKDLTPQKDESIEEFASRAEWAVVYSVHQSDREPK